MKKCDEKVNVLHLISQTIVNLDEVMQEIISDYGEGGYEKTFNDKGIAIKYYGKLTNIDYYDDPYNGNEEDVENSNFTYYKKEFICLSKEKIKNKIIEMFNENVYDSK